MGARSKGGSGLVIALVLVGVALVFLGLRTQRVVTVEIPTYAYDPTTQGDLGPIIVGTTESGGFSLLGLQLSEPDHTASVRFLAPEACAAELSGEGAWPAAAPECETPYAIQGTTDGTGTAPDGRTLIGVAIDVPAACAEAVELGSVWPPPNPACAAIPSE
jgi:hypothetical protein